MKKGNKQNPERANGAFCSDKSAVCECDRVLKLSNFTCGVNSMEHLCNDAILLHVKLIHYLKPHVIVCLCLFLFSPLSLTLCPCLGAWGRVGGADSFSLHFVSSCLLLVAAAHYCSGGWARGPCWEAFSSTAAAAASACQTAPVGSHPHTPWAAADSKIRDESVTFQRQTHSNSQSSSQWSRLHILSERPLF